MPLRPTLLMLAALSLGSALPATAQTVQATYAGLVDDDSGLGLIGQTMRVSMVYDASVAPDYAFANTRAAGFFGFLQSMSVSVGALQWTWQSSSGGSFLSLEDDAPRFFTPVEDVVVLDAYGFAGTDPSPDTFNHSLAIYLYDHTNADGLADYATIPSQPIDPVRFEDGQVMEFSFTVGDPELGDIYRISTQAFGLAAPVPEPGTLAMWLAGVGVLGSLSTRRLRAGR